MKIKVIIIVLFSILCSNIKAQKNFYGYIIDSLTNKPVANAIITNLATKKTVTTGFNGKFLLNSNISVLPLKIEHPAYKTRILRVNIKAKGTKIYISPYSKQISAVEIPFYKTGLDQQLPEAIQNINSKKIGKITTALNVVNFLQYTSSITKINPLGIFESSPIVTINGMAGSPQRSLIIYNGIRLNTANDGNSNWNMLPAISIRSIKFYPVPVSDIYGNNAANGSIVIIPDIRQTAGNDLTIKTIYSSYNTLSAQMKIRHGHYSNKGFYSTLSASAQKSDGYINVPDSLQSPDIQYIPSYLKQLKINTIAGYDFNESSSIELTSNFSSGLYGKGEKIQEPDGQYVKTHDMFVAIKYKKSFSKLKTLASFYFLQENYFKNIEKLRSNNYTLIYVNSLRTDAGGSLSATYKANKKLFASVGIETNYGNVNGADNYQTSDIKILNSGKLLRTNAYTKIIWSVTPNVTFSAGTNLDYSILSDLSYQFNGDPGFYYSFADTGHFAEKKYLSSAYNLNLKIKKRNFTFTLFAGQSYNLPTLDDLTRSGFMRSGFKVANPKLKPEKIISTGLTGLYRTKILDISLAAKYSSSNDFITFITIDSSLYMPVIQKQNIGKVNSVNIFGNIEIKTKYLNVFANASVNNNTILEPLLMKNLQLIFTPSKSARMGFKLKYLNTIISFSANYTSIIYLDSYNKFFIPEQLTFDAKAIVKLTKNFEMSASINNIFDNKYLVYYNQTSLGRFISFSICSKF